jgi:hypothetical protein
MVLSPTRGAVSGDGFWLQPFEDGSSGFFLIGAAAGGIIE